MPKTHDLVAIVGSYTNNQGEEKKRYKNCGIVIQKDGKMYVKLDAIPIPEDGPWNGFLSCFEPREKGQQAPRGHSADTQEHDFNDEIPFR